jgi:PilZ domain-containing protein
VKKWQKVTGAKEQREHERKRVFLKATMITAAGTFRAFVRNLSCGGALLDCTAAGRRGDSVQLRCDLLLADATIAWTHGKQMGLQFAQPLPESLIAACLGAPPPRRRGERSAAHPIGASTGVPIATPTAGG